MILNTYKIITYGCQMNESDSARMGAQLESIGYTETASMQDAQVILINTCCVRESAENKIFGKIGELKHIKEQAPQTILGVTGCMAQKDGEALLKKMPHLDFVMGTNKIHELCDLIDKIKAKQRHLVDLAPADGGTVQEVMMPRSSSWSVWLPIMYGCNNFCTYCIVPYVRGREHSRTLESIIEEAQRYVDQGVKEITLLGQNVNSYGKDISQSSFAELLRELDAIKGLERIRYMTSHPRDLNEQVIKTIKDSSHICTHFHLPVQHGSDKILKAMNRGYTTDAYRRLIAKIRDEIPEYSLTTDIIVGFPGETDDDFQQLLEFMQGIEYDAAYTFLYSKRSGTPAATMAEQVPQELKKQRLQQLMDIQNKISLKLNTRLQDKVVEVMVEGPSRTEPAVYTGRTTTNKIVLWERLGTEKPGDLLHVKIKHPQTWVLKGEAING